MFYDERIESVKGKIAKKAIIFTFMITLVLSPIHCANLLRNATDNRYYWFALFDVFAFLSSVVTLTIGLVRHIVDCKDERTVSEQDSFFSKAASILIKTALGVFAFDIPIALFIGKPTSFADGGPSGVLYVSLFIIGAFVVYSFKKNDIYFNYSIMDNNHYTKSVLKNIGKAALYALVFLGISTISFVGFLVLEMPNSEQTINVLLDTVAFYVGAFIEVVLLYILYSFLEKCSYKSENSISKSTIISLIITIAIYAVYTASVIFIDSVAISQAAAVQIVSIISSFDIYIRFALLIFLTYFGYEYQRVRKNKLISDGCIIILLSETISAFAGQISGSLIFVFMPELMSRDAFFINDLFSTIKTIFTDVSTLANIVGFVLIIFALVKDQLIHKAHRFAIGVFAILVAIELFMRTQTDYLTVNIYHFIVEIIVLCYFASLVLCVSKKIKAT